MMISYNITKQNLGEVSMKRSGLLVMSILFLFSMILSSCANGINFEKKNPFGDGSWVNSICYSGIRNEGGIPTEPQILEDLRILESTRLNPRDQWLYLRMYASSEYAEKTLKVIRDNNLPAKIYMGLAIGYGIDTNEITNFFRLYQTYSSEMLAVSVGNECVEDWSDHPIPSGLLNDYILWVKSNVAIPVTSDLDCGWWSGAGGYTNTNFIHQIVSNVDFIAMHTYPFKRKQTYDQGLAMSKVDYNLIHNKYPQKYIVIGEAGWSTAGYNASLNLFGAANELAQKNYYNDLITWAKNNNIITFWFEAFDEQWKGAQSDPEPHYGLFTTNRYAKMAMTNEFPWLLEPGHDYTTNIPVPPPLVTNTSTFTNDPITNDIFLIYSEGVSGEVNPAAFWNLWEGTCDGWETNLDPFEGSKCFYTVGSHRTWGWGFGNETFLTNHSNLSGFTNGYYVFSIKTIYGNVLAFGFTTGVYGQNNVDCFLNVTNSMYGFTNDGSWHRLVIPVQDIMAVASPKIPNMYDVTSTFALRSLANSDLSNAVYLDNIYWTQTSNTNL
jgi:exo-beta-1,3-glucanase (GH17 family)